MSRDLRPMPNGMARIVAQALSFVKKSSSAPFNNIIRTLLTALPVGRPNIEEASRKV